MNNSKDVGNFEPEFTEEGFFFFQYLSIYFVFMVLDARNSYVNSGKNIDKY